jgi:hypothetical protein
LVLPVKGDGVTISSDGNVLLIKADIPEVDTNYVSYTQVQLLTEEQKAIARANIGADTGGGGGGGTSVTVLWWED